jgi:hypothetical protein
MNKTLRKLLGVMGIGLSWGTLWGALCATLVLIVGVVALRVTLRASQAADPLPAPTGPHKTRRMSFHWRDAARAELETSAPDDKRELMVHLFYPADANASGARAPYIPDNDAMRGPLISLGNDQHRASQFWVFGQDCSATIKEIPDRGERQKATPVARDSL